MSCSQEAENQVTGFLGGGLPQDASYGQRQVGRVVRHDAHILSYPVRVPIY